MGELPPELAPVSDIPGTEVEGLEAARAGGHGGDEAHGATDDRARRGVLATGRAALVIAGRPEIVLQIVVRSGEIRRVVAVEQTRPVTAPHLEEVAHGGAQRAGGCLSLGHLGQEGGIGAADLGPRLARLIGEQVGRSVDPPIRQPNVWPERGGRPEPAGQEKLQALEFGRESPFCATRSIEA